jgi:hypothetical protein
MENIKIIELYMKQKLYRKWQKLYKNVAEVSTADLPQMVKLLTSIRQLLGSNFGRAGGFIFVNSRSLWC